MSDLISRSRAIKEVSEWATDILHPKNLIKEDAIGILESLPSAEPNTKCIAQIRIDRDDMEDLVNEAVKKMVEPKTGKWVEVEDYNGDIHYQCNQCKNEFILIDGTPQDNDYKYCPNCGAYMKGENK